MSKSKGNVIDPLDIVDEFGADTLRTYILFMGDYGVATPWNDSSMKGCKRFLERVAALTDMLKDGETPASFETTLHKTIKKVSSDIENMKFNTAIAGLMSMLNEIYSLGYVTKEMLTVFIKLLCPFAPHLCEEIWETLGNEDFLSLSEWPKYDENKTVDKEIEIAVQINGKTRGILAIPVNEEKDKVLESAKAMSKIAEAMEGKRLIKEIYVPNKIVNFVVK